MIDHLTNLELTGAYGDDNLSAICIDDAIKINQQFGKYIFIQITLHISLYIPQLLLRIIIIIIINSMAYEIWRLIATFTRALQYSQS